MPPFIVSVKLVVSLKAGRALGRYATRLRVEDPSGAEMPLGESSVHLQGGKTGINLISEVQFAAQHEGVYWFDVLFAPGKGQDDVLLTRVPLEIVYRPERLPSQANG
jgi:hypothetical protein